MNKVNRFALNIPSSCLDTPDELAEKLECKVIMVEDDGVVLFLK